MKFAPRLEPEHLANGASAESATNNSIDYQTASHDDYALEEALQIKDIFPDSQIDCITVGPPQVELKVKNSLEKGADRAILLRSKSHGLLSSSLAAAIVANWLVDKSYNLILTGAMSDDLNAAIFGPSLATRLSLPWAASVIETDYDWSDSSITVACELEGGLRRNQRLPLPCLLTVVSGINRPRYPALSHKLRARKQTVECSDVRPSSVTEKAPHIIGVFRPPVNDATEYLKGTTEQKAADLFDLLHGKSLL